MANPVNGPELQRRAGSQILFATHTNDCKPDPARYIQNNQQPAECQLTML